jgi:hypothetical protein
MLLAAFVTADVDTIVQSGRREERVRFAQRDFVAEEQILPTVKFMILADDNPDILAIKAHWYPPRLHEPGERLSTIVLRFRGSSCKQVVKSRRMVDLQAY